MTHCRAAGLERLGRKFATAVTSVRRGSSPRLRYSHGRARGKLYRSDTAAGRLVADLEDGFLRRNVRHELVVLDDDSMTIRTRHDIELVAERASRFLVHAYSWSGSGVEGRPVVNSGWDELGHQNHRLHGDVVRDASTGRLMVVDLGRTMEAGEDDSVSISHFFVDTGRSFKPRLSHSPRRGTERVSLVVRLPAGSSKTVSALNHKNGASHPSSQNRLEPVSVADGNMAFDEYTFTINAPQTSSRYSLEW
jgi:hypothetical protein